jgi:agmatinase
VIAACLVQIGIRSAGERAARDYVRDRGGQIFTARDLRGLESPSNCTPVLQAIRPAGRPGPPAVYLSLDIDCLDPAFAPGTGTPEPGGLSTNQVLSAAGRPGRPALRGHGLRGGGAAYDHAELTSNAAAHFVWTYLCGRWPAAGLNPALMARS